MTFLIENAVYRCGHCWRNCFKSKAATQPMIIKKKKLKLDNWKNKFIFKRISKWQKHIRHEISESKENNLKLMLRNGRKEFFKCRESIGGGYFIVKKFNIKNEKPRLKQHRIIQVQAINEE